MREFFGTLALATVSLFLWLENNTRPFFLQGKISVVLPKGEEWEFAGETVYLISKENFQKAESIAKKVILENNEEILAGKRQLEEKLASINNELRGLTTEQIIAKALVGPIIDRANAEYWAKILEAGTSLLKANIALDETSLNCCRKIYNEINVYERKTSTDGDGRFSINMPTNEEWILMCRNQRSKGDLAGEPVKENSYFWFFPVSCKKYYERAIFGRYHLPFQKPIIEDVKLDNSNLSNNNYAYLQKK